MTNKHYDEFQLAKRYEISFQTLILTFLLLMMNRFLKKYYSTWANPMNEMLVIIYIPGLYFALSTIMKDAYLRKRDHDHSILIIITMGIAAMLGGASIIKNMTTGIFLLIDNGMLTDQIGILLITIFSASISIALLMRYLKEKREFDKESE